MASLFDEMKRRNVFKVGIAYVIVAWVGLQFVDVMGQLLELPKWFGKAMFVLLATGFPIALVLSWAYELTPQGLKKTADVKKSKSSAPKTGGRINKVIAVGLALALAFIVYDKMIVTETPVVTKAEAGQTAIAVLPFVNMSSDPEQEFFSDGITEEILNVLAKNRSLRVAGRTSSFAYKGKDLDLRKIGQELGVDYVIEGSIRKSGPTVRITAQVIQAKDGFHVWSETYDRELTDIFAVQDEIARAVSDALKVSFGQSAGESLVANTTENMAAYDLYLKAKDAHKFRRIPDAIELARQVTDMEPDYAPGWAVYAQTLALAPNWIYGNEPLESAGAFGRAEVAAQRALFLDPKSVEALGALANVKRTRHQWAEAEALYREALSIDADSPVILEDYSEFFLAVGKFREAKAIALKLSALEPQVPIYQNNLQVAYDSEGDLGQALALAERIYRLTPETETFAVAYAQALANAGRLDEARAFARTSPVLTDFFRKYMDLYIIAKTPGTKTLEPEQAEYVRDDPFLMAAFEMKEPLFQWLSRETRLGWWGDFFNFSFDMKKFRGTPEFKAYMEQLKLPAYWRANGWPDACRPKGADDFECKS